MNSYIAMKNRHQQEVNALPIKFAFSDKQFEEGMKELGLKPTDTDKVYALVGNGFYRKTDADLIHGTFKRHKQERDDAIAADKDGTGYLFEMFEYELGNHEYCVTYDCEDAVNACGYTCAEVLADPILNKALSNAVSSYLKWAKEMGLG